MQHPEGCGRQLPRREGLSGDLLRYAVTLAFRRRAVSECGRRPAGFRRFRTAAIQVEK